MVFSDSFFFVWYGQEHKWLNNESVEYYCRFNGIALINNNFPAL